MAPTKIEGPWTTGPQPQISHTDFVYKNPSSNVCDLFQWGAKALRNMLIVPPGSGIVHQVNLEYLGRVVFNTNGMLYPDSLVGTDSHTTMINGLGIVGWGMYQ